MPNPSPNARLEAFLSDHVVTLDGLCSCGWNLANYDLRRYDWEDSDAPARRRAWISHIRRIWGNAHGLGLIQQATATDPNGDDVVFDMEPGYDSLAETPMGLGRRYKGEYRYADYEPPPPPPGSLPSRHVSCEEAGCRDPDCLGVHRTFTLRMPTQKCAGCGRPFEEDDERVGVMLGMPSGTVIEEGTALATTATYHASCRPSDEELRVEAEKLWPKREAEESGDTDVPRQAMACLACGLAGETPEEHFPQPAGLWDRPCPECGERMVWVTEPTDE